MPIRRYDAATVQKSVKTDAGFLKAPARLTRVGVFDYREPGGKVRRELRLPEEVFSADSLDSFQLVPLTNNHPSIDDGKVTSKNAGLLQVGTVGQDVARDGSFVAATVLVTDAKAIEQIESGKVELSCGYFCDLEPAAGVWQDDAGVVHPYDAIQRNIRGNHVALVAMGRAGKEVRLLLDSQDAMRVECDKQEQGQPAKEDIKPMEKLTLDGIEVELSTTAKSIVTKALDTAAAAVEKLTARADTAEARATELAAKLEVATSPAATQAAVQARVALETKAAEHGIKADGLSDDEVRKQVIAKLSPGLALEGKSAEYLAAAYDAVLAIPSNPAAVQMKSKLDSAPAVSANLDPRAEYTKAFFGQKK